MKKFLISAACLLMPLLAIAQGWPANYGGVMLQGFYWDSYSETSWTKLTSQADTLAKYFNLIWVPQSGWCNGTNQMGYGDIWWLDQHSAFGSEAELKTMIKTFKDKGLGTIEDVVINHKSGNTNWVDFPDETYTSTTTGKTYTLTWTPLADICNTDEANRNANSGVAGKITGAADTGDDFDGSRDLDHTNTEVQNNIKTYLDFLKNEMGYIGFRYDMVKGYAPEYTKIYNESSQPEFSVGEYWDGSYDKVYGWCKRTGDAYRSAAFDFPLKINLINNAFQSGDFTQASNKFSSKGLAADATNGANRYSVTFVDNHDTDRNSDKLSNNVLAANAFILAMPGTPCLFWKHWTDATIQPELKKMILARKAAGITNQSTIVKEGYDTDGDGYYMVVRGEKGYVMVHAGYVTGISTDGYKIVSHGTEANPNFAYYVKLDDEPAPHNNDDIHIYVTASSTPKIYVWDNNNKPLNGDFPGNDMQTVTINHTTYYTYTTSTKPINFILSYGGNDTKTDDINNVSTDRYYSYKTDRTNKLLELTTAKYDPTTYTAFCLFPSDNSNTPNAWVWKTPGNTNFNNNTSYPGDAMSSVGEDGSQTFYKWRYNGTSTDAPNMIQFNINNGSSKTADLAFNNGNVYDWGGDNGGNPELIYSGLPVFGEAASARTFAADNNSTFALPFNLNEDEVAKLGGKVYELKDFDSEGVLHFEEVKTVKAFHPYLFVADSEVAPFSSFANRVWQQGSGVDQECNGFHFVAHVGNRTNLKSDASKTYYAYSNGTFYKANAKDGMNVNGYRCYFYQSASSAAAKPLKISIDGGSATGINSVSSNSARKDNAWYNLQGQRVSKPAHGIYIHNGKKIIINRY